MQFGMPTLIELKSIERAAALCRELGLDFVELNMNLPEYQPERLDLSLLGRAAQENRIGYTAHLDENFNPSDFNSLIAEAYTETALKAIEIAKALGMPVLNMHMNPGVSFTLPKGKVFLFDEYRPEYLRKLAAFRGKIADAAEDSGLKVTIENCSDFHLPYVLDGLDTLLQSPTFALCFDVGHNAASGGADEAAVFARIERLQHMHVHDALGKRGHLPLGEGDVDLAACLKLAEEHNCRAVVEVKTVQGLRSSVGWLKANGFL